LHLVGHSLTKNCDARSHEHKILKNGEGNTFVALIRPSTIPKPLSFLISEPDDRLSLNFVWNHGIRRHRDVLFFNSLYQ